MVKVIRIGRWLDPIVFFERWRGVTAVRVGGVKCRVNVGISIRDWRVLKAIVRHDS